MVRPALNEYFGIVSGDHVALVGQRATHHTVGSVEPEVEKDSRAVAMRRSTRRINSNEAAFNMDITRLDNDPSAESAVDNEPTNHAAIGQVIEHQANSVGKDSGSVQLDPEHGVVRLGRPVRIGTRPRL